MAQQDEPLYDFPEPSQSSQRKLLAHQRGRGSLRSISVLDRLLLTVPVWLQLSINPATALHILRREPPGTFLVRKSRTSQRNVLCLRLADNSVPSFVQQFGIREEHSTFSLETSAISFPDLPRLISFYCVSRDVLPFPLELPEAIARATSHKELESISHMGVEFWNSHLNVRGPREAVKPQPDNEKKTDAAAAAPPTSHPPTSSAAQPDPATQPNSDTQLGTSGESDKVGEKPGTNATLFREFCPITTRSPRELNFGSGRGALCFINPLFLQSMTAFTRRRMFKRSLKVRVSTETSSLLSPPLISPPPPPLMPKAKGRCRVLKKSPLGQTDAKGENGSEARTQPTSETPEAARVMGEEGAAQLVTVMEDPPDDSEYMQPPPAISLSRPLPPSSVSPAAAPPLFPKAAAGLCPRSSPGASPAHSPYQSPSLSPKVPLSLSPHDSPTASPSLSPYQSPSPSPKLPFSLSPFTSPTLSQLAEEAAYHTPATLSRADRSVGDAEEEEDEEADSGEEEEDEELLGEIDARLVLQMNAACVLDTDSCSSFSSLEEAAESPPRLPEQQDSQEQHT